MWSIATKGGAAVALPLKYLRKSINFSRLLGIKSCIALHNFYQTPNFVPLLIYFFTLPVLLQSLSYVFSYFLYLPSFIRIFFFFLYSYFTFCNFIFLGSYSDIFFLHLFTLILFSSSQFYTDSFCIFLVLHDHFLYSNKCYTSSFILNFNYSQLPFFTVLFIRCCLSKSSFFTFTDLLLGSHDVKKSCRDCIHNPGLVSQIRKALALLFHSPSNTFLFLLNFCFACERLKDLQTYKLQSHWQHLLPFFFDTFSTPITA